MKTSFSSAGLLYVYITGYKEMELLHIEQIERIGSVNSRQELSL